MTSERQVSFSKNKWKISIYFLVNHVKRGLKKNLLSVLVDITTMYCILVGLSYPQMVSLLYKLILNRSAFFYRFHKRACVYMRWLRRLVTLAFFLHYLRIVLSDSLNGMVQSTFVDENLGELAFPMFGLCFDIDSKKALNNLTGFELDALAVNISGEPAFALESPVGFASSESLTLGP